MDVERITLPDGGWWEIRSVVTRKMRKQFRAAGIQTVLAGISSNGDADLSDAEGLKRLILAHPEKINLEAINDAFLLYGSMAWSYPGAITLETIDALPDSTVNLVLERVKVLYAEPTEAALKN